MQCPLGAHPKKRYSLSGLRPLIDIVALEVERVPLREVEHQPQQDRKPTPKIRRTQRRCSKNIHQCRIGQEDNAQQRKKPAVKGFRKDIGEEEEKQKRYTRHKSGKHSK